VSVPLPEHGGRQTTGALTLAASGGGVLYGFAVSPDGDGGGDVGAFRITAQGRPDMSFAGNGIVFTTVDPAGGRPSVAAASPAGDRVALGGFRQAHLGSGNVWLAEITRDAGLSMAFEQGVSGDGGFASSGSYEVEGMIREPGSDKLIVGGIIGNGFFVARVFP
jgi:hypothetical protein